MLYNYLYVKFNFCQFEVQGLLAYLYGQRHDDIYIRAVNSSFVNGQLVTVKKLCRIDSMSFGVV